MQVAWELRKSSRNDSSTVDILKEKIERWRSSLERLAHVYLANRRTWGCLPARAWRRVRRQWNWRDINTRHPRQRSCDCLAVDHCRITNAFAAKAPARTHVGRRLNQNSTDNDTNALMHIHTLTMQLESPAPDESRIVRPQASGISSYLMSKGAS